MKIIKFDIRVHITTTNVSTMSVTDLLNVHAPLHIILTRFNGLMVLTRSLILSSVNALCLCFVVVRLSVPVCLVCIVLLVSIGRAATITGTRSTNTCFKTEIPSCIYGTCKKRCLSCEALSVHAIH